jgi:hypothetical protein
MSQTCSSCFCCSLSIVLNTFTAHCLSSLSFVSLPRCTTEQPPRPRVRVSSTCSRSGSQRSPRKGAEPRRGTTVRPCAFTTMRPPLYSVSHCSLRLDSPRPRDALPRSEKTRDPRPLLSQRGVQQGVLFFSLN